MNTDGSGTATLTLQSVVYEDVGEYICSATLSSGTLTDTFMLTIIGRYHISIDDITLYYLSVS